jgi:Uma2 family endonuclease
MALTRPTRHGRNDHVPAERQPDTEPEQPDAELDRADPGPQDLDDETATVALCQELNDAGYTAEISWGRVVVSPWQSKQSSHIVDELADLLIPLKLANGWRFHHNLAVHIPPFLDHRLPDLMVAPRDAEHVDDLRIKGDSTLLVVEVCSPGTRQTDWFEKPFDYARAGVPLLLVVDPLADPKTVTLMSEPLEDLAQDDMREPYKQVVTVEAGEALALPEPFGIKLETEKLFE